ncbi:MAG: hypothetical protein ACR2J3_06350 [Aridibacter sp.]
MIETLEAKDELKTVIVEKDTWILELPSEICQKEGFADGTLVSLTIKNSGIQASFINPPSKKLQEISKRLLKKNHKLYEELKQIGD